MTYFVNKLSTYLYNTYSIYIVVNKLNGLSSYT